MAVPRGFQLPNPVNDGRFPMPSGKAVFTCNALDNGMPPLRGTVSWSAVVRPSF